MRDNPDLGGWQLEIESSTQCFAGACFHQDERGSIVAVSDGSGNSIGIDSYDEYGVPDASLTSRFSYTGQIWLPEVKLYYYKARMYSPHLGRFMQTDPIGYGDSMNMYAYVANDPIGKIDPTGTWELLTFAKEEPNYYSWTFVNWAGGMVTAGHADPYRQMDSRPETPTALSHLDPAALYREMKEVAGEAMVGKPIILLGCNSGTKDPERDTVFAADIAKLNSSPFVMAAEGFTTIRSTGGERFNPARDLLYVTVTTENKQDAPTGFFVKMDASGAVLAKYSVVIIDQNKGTLTFKGGQATGTRIPPPDLVCDQDGCK